MNRFFTALVVSGCLVSGFCFPVFSEDLTITTYYPSPYGVYANLRSDQMAIGSGYRASTPPSNGLLVQGNVSIGYGADTGYPLYVSGNAVATGDIYLGARGRWLSSVSWCVARSFSSNSGTTPCPAGSYAWFGPITFSSTDGSAITPPTSGSFLCCS